MNPILQTLPAHAALDISELRFQRLRSAAAIRRILHLRDEIELPAEIRMSAAFVAGEKKRPDRCGRSL